MNHVDVVEAIPHDGETDGDGDASPAMISSGPAMKKYQSGGAPAYSQRECC